jgi:Arc/MetJ-type ribon-helix-helix transcriptional regulator
MSIESRSHIELADDNEPAVSGTDSPWRAQRSATLARCQGIAARFARLRRIRGTPSYDPGMSDRKARLTITVDPHLSAYAEHLVETGKAPSVSAVFNDAMEARIQRERRQRRLWKEAAERADPAKVARMMAHVDAQAAALPKR